MCLGRRRYLDGVCVRLRASHLRLVESTLKSLALVFTQSDSHSLRDWRQNSCILFVWYYSHKTVELHSHNSKHDTRYGWATGTGTRYTRDSSTQCSLPLRHRVRVYGKSRARSPQTVSDISLYFPATIRHVCHVSSFRLNSRQAR